MLRESTTAVVSRNETWVGRAVSEPYEAGWAREAVVFIRALKAPKGSLPDARLRISADGIHWADEGTHIAFPSAEGEVTFARAGHFGNWLQVAADLPEGAEITLIVTLHLKA